MNSAAREMAKKILIVEDQFIEANNLKLILQNANYEVLPIARTVPEALSIVALKQPDIVLLDIFLKTHETGIDLARILKQKSIAFIFLSANSDPATFKEAKDTGPYGFLVKPFRNEDVLAMLDIAQYLHQQHLSLIKMLSVSQPAGQSYASSSTSAIIGSAPQVAEVKKLIAIASNTDFPVLILGESGTGKELVAKAIHQSSRHKNVPLIVVDCAALPEHLVEAELFGHEKGSFTGAFEKRIGKFDLANGGTIFLDEIGELSLEMQVKFLRVLQEKEISPIGGKARKINVRVMAATNRNLEEQLAAGKFRMDLYYRLNVFPIELPSLRERSEDIPVLANHFLKMFSGREHKTINGFSKEVTRALRAYGWPGNIRELENLVARAVLLCEGTEIASFPLPQRKPSPPQLDSGIKTISQNERDHILAALKLCNWKIYGRGGAAELLDINGSTLKSRMNKLGIEKHFNEGSPLD
jgi:two-component system response regulator HydG